MCRPAAPRARAWPPRAVWRGPGLVLAACLWLAAGGVARAEAHALLVGVSRYDAFAGDESLQLSGPRNDVALLRALLLRQAFAPGNVRLLADGVPGAGAPTRAAILGALDELAGRVGAGDFVLLYFAGHGSQMPADAATPEGRAEADGLHEIFLPADVGRWNGTTGRVDNAIADHELVRRLDAMLARGAFVWAVFDACHSATLMRGGGAAEVRFRHVPPARLGVPAAALERAADAARRAGGAARSLTEGGPGRPGDPEPLGTAFGAPGSFVAFYAAQTTQTTPEMPLPAGGPDRRPHGLFTFALAEGLESVPGASHRQLAQFILGRYAAQNVSSPTPLFTGTGLDAPLFGRRDGQALRQWPVEVTPQGVRVRAGSLGQLESGAVLDILPGPLAASHERLGTVRVARADLMSADLVAVAVPGAAAVDVKAWPVTAVARLVQAALPRWRLRAVAPPVAADADSLAVARAIEALRQAPGTGIEVSWVEAGTAHDLRLRIDAGRLWLLPPTDQWYRSGPHQTPSLAIDAPGLPARLDDALQRAARAQNLMRLASLLPDPAAAALLRVEGTVRPARGAPRPLDGLAPAAAGEGDSVVLEVRNAHREAVDLTVLYVDAAFGITALYPHPRGASNRLEPGDRVSVLAHIDTTTRGLERIVLIAVAARAQAERQDFSFLEQARPERARSGAGGDGLRRLFEEAGFGGPATTPRGSRGGWPADAERLEMQVYRLQVQ